MAVKIFFGYPPDHIKKWIKDHDKSSFNGVKITFKNGTKLNIEDIDLTKSYSLYDKYAEILGDSPYNTDAPMEIDTIEIGTNVTHLGRAFYNFTIDNLICTSSVTSIDKETFTFGFGRDNDVHITFPAFTKNDIYNMFIKGDYWIESGTDNERKITFTCKDGDIILTWNENKSEYISSYIPQHSPDVNPYNNPY